MQAPKFDVLINGTPVSAAVLRYVGDVVVDDSSEWPSMFSFLMLSSDVQDQDLPWVDDKDLFSIGNVVEIKMAAADAGKLTSFIVGEITALEPEFVTSGIPVMRVHGYDRRHRLQRGRKTRTFLKKKDSDIASEIGREAGLSVKATDSSIRLDYILQANQTDWEFLCERARLIRYEVAVSDKTLFFRPVQNNQSEILSLDWKSGLSEFYPRLSLAGLATEVKVRSWSVKDKKALLGYSKVGDETSTMGGQSSGAAIAKSAFGDAIDVVSNRPVAAQAEADQLAKARFNDVVMELITGEGVCQGNPDIRAGKVIKIGSIGQRFSGSYYVTSAIHRLSPHSGYWTDFTVRRSAT